MDLDENHLHLLKDWNEAREQLKHWTKLESDLRDKLVTQLFDSSKTEGTETLELQGDWKLKATKRLSFNLSNKDGALVSILQTLPSIIAENLIRWNPDLNLTMYRKLDAPTQQLFTPVLTIKPGKPTLELVPPNANKLHEPNQT